MRGSHLPSLILLSLILATAGVAPSLGAERLYDRLRGDTAIDRTPPSPPLAPLEKSERRRTRNYPEQPPVIPHSVAGYEISVRANRCLSCHSRRRSAATGAPMVSVSHFMDRDFQVLSDISARRYFCNQCHVVQTSARPPVTNDFTDGADLPRQ